MISLANVFQSGMTIQRDKDFKIFGTAQKRLALSVLVNGSVACAIEVDEGDFVICAKAQPKLFDAVVEIKYDGGQITLDNVDFGDVYIAGGQSNMEFRMRNEMHFSKEKAVVNDRHLRFYDVPRYAFFGEENDGFKDKDRLGEWYNAEKKHLNKFSAVGYYFAKELRAKYPDVPMAIVGCNWPGTTASAWLDRAILERDWELRVYVDEYEKAIEGLDIEEYNRIDYMARKSAASFVQRTVWNTVLKRTDKFFLYLVERFGKDAAVGPRSQNRPGALYETMFKKIKDLSVKAVIWYQGESDVYHSDIYDKLFSALILNWRDSLGDIPFMFVQLAPFSYWLASRGDGFSRLRQKQELVSRNLPGAYMVSIMDVGDEDDIHPKDKKTVGERLALMARGKIYGEDIVCEPMGPIACSLFANSLKIDFDNAKEIRVRGEKINGLEIKNGESNVEVIGFKTEGSSLILTLDGEYDSLDVSLMDCPFVEGNLYSDSGLCAKPFSIKTNP